MSLTLLLPLSNKPRDERGMSQLKVSYCHLQGMSTPMAFSGFCGFLVV